MPAPRRDLDLTKKRLLKWLPGRMPGATDLQISNLKGPSDTGFSSDTLIVDLAWREGGRPLEERLVVRIEPRGFNIFPNYDVALQYRVMKALASTDVPVPEMRWLETGESTLGAPFYVMSWLEGRVPTDNPPYNVGGWVPQLSPEERAALWWSGLDAMARFHRVDWRALGFEDLAEPHRGATPLDQQLHYYDEYFTWAVEDRSRYPLIDEALAWLRANRPATETVGLCWGDSRLANMIFRGTECVAVIDWEMMRLGDPVQDLAWWITADRCFTEGIDVPRLPGFPSYPETVARWESVVGRRAEHLKYYEVLALMRFSVIMARLILQMKHYEILPADHDMDVNNLASATLTRVLAEARV